MDRLLVSREERAEIAKTCIFKEVRGQKIIDLSKAIVVMREFRKKKGLSSAIELRQIDTYVKGKFSRTFSLLHDNDFNVSYGMISKIDDKGYITWVKQQFDTNIMFNIDNDQQAKQWLLFRMHPLVQGSPIFSSDKKMFHVIDHSADNRSKIEKAKKYSQIINYLEKCTSDEIVMLSRLFGLNSEIQDESAMDRSILEGKLLDKAEKNPFDFESRYTAKTSQIEANVEAARNYSIITENQDGGLIFNEIYLGHSVNDAVDKLAKDRTLLTAVINEVGRNDSLKSIIAEKESIINKKEALVLDNDDDEL